MEVDRVYLYFQAVVLQISVISDPQLSHVPRRGGEHERARTRSSPLSAQRASRGPR